MNFQTNSGSNLTLLTWIFQEILSQIEHFLPWTLRNFGSDRTLLTMTFRGGFSCSYWLTSKLQKRWKSERYRIWSLAVYWTTFKPKKILIGAQVRPDRLWHRLYWKPGSKADRAMATSKYRVFATNDKYQILKWLGQVCQELHRSWPIIIYNYPVDLPVLWAARS